MCLLLETIRIEHRAFCHTEYHQARIDRSRKALFRTWSDWSLSEIRIPETLGRGVYKCRIIYGSQLDKVEYEKYAPKIIRTLGLVDAGELAYPFKYLDRSRIERLQKANDQVDEIILVKNGCITDTSFSNLAFLSENRWYTPVEPLLAGTCRQRLIEQGVLEPVRITPGDIPRFSHVSLINSMMPLQEGILPIEVIQSGKNVY